MPKLLKFKFDDKTLKKKYKQRASPENPSPTKRNLKRKISFLFLGLDTDEWNIEFDEENVIDDNEEQNWFILNNPGLVKKPIPYMRKTEKEIQTDDQRTKSRKLQTDLVERKIPNYCIAEVKVVEKEIIKIVKEQSNERNRSIRTLYWQIGNSSRILR
jgi:hypothetical protein